MNTTPDETLLALWMEDELHGEEFATVDAWASARPEHLAARESLRGWKRQVSSAIPASEEPPYPDFFNHRIERSIRELQTTAPAAASAPGSLAFWRSWFLPAGAFAGMALAFWMGQLSQSSAPVGGPAGIASTDGWEPVVYTPDQAVDAEWFASSSADATVIVLNGLHAIPDHLELTGTALVPPRDNGMATAETGQAVESGVAR